MKLGDYLDRFLFLLCEIESYPTMRFDFNEIPNGFLVELNYKDQKISSEKRNERINERINALTKNERSIMEAIEKNPRITQAQLAESLNLTEQYIRKLIRKLKNAALIQRIGSNKTGFWEITF